MSYALSGSTPDPIPTENTEAALAARVGVIVGGGRLFLKTDLTVQNVPQDRARSAVDVVRAALTSSGATVSEVGWVAGGKIRVKWKPNQDTAAVEYATQLRELLLRAAQQIGPEARIILSYVQIDMPSGQEDLYIYPVQVASILPTRWVSRALMGASALLAIGVFTATIFLSRGVRRNRRRRRR